MTNYERIKNMSIEEMQKDCDKACDGRGCEDCEHYRDSAISWAICEKHLKEWLESEAENE